MTGRVHTGRGTVREISQVPTLKPTEVSSSASAKMRTRSATCLEALTRAKVPSAMAERISTRGNRLWSLNPFSTSERLLYSLPV
eukprot:2046696-Rhodomonas_salina.1